MVLHLPPVRTLGGARVQVELADALRHQGHEVDFLTGPDVYPDPPRNKLDELLRTFSLASRGALRRSAGAYDVIDGLEGDVTISKADLRFDGVLAARSVGLLDAYARWRRVAAKSRPELRGRLLSRGPRLAQRRYKLWQGNVSRKNADGVFVPNSAEHRELVAELGPTRVCQLPFGLSDAHRHALAEAASSRLDTGTPCVAFLGTWDVRKGKCDFARILCSVRSAEPHTAFKFLGTRASREQVLSDLGIGSSGSIEVVPQFESESLPELLASATVAVFPSYVEGLPFAILEQLAAGLPVVAYDIPGPRDILAELNPALLVPSGDTAVLAARLVMAARGELVQPQACIDRAAAFRWDDIAEKTLAAYATWASA